MPRDDLSIDFVKKMAPSVEAQDPAMILDDWIHRTQNLPEEIRFMQDEIADRDRTFNDCVKTIEENDVKIQRWIRLHGSHQPNPREAQLREVIRDNFTRADKLAHEKIALTEKMKTLYDKHLRHLDIQIKQLYDRGEPGFTDHDEMPSLLRPSAANNSNVPSRVQSVANSPLSSITNNATPSGPRGNLHIRTTSLQGQHSSSAPASPAASMLLNRTQRESSAGPGGNVGPKRGPRASLGLGSVPAASSGLARHSSLGPGTPKAGTPGATGRAGSAGPRGSTKGSGPGTGRKGTPTAGVARKKPPSKSTLSRVKRAGTSKGSPASTAESELSDADSLPSSRGGRSASRAGSGTPVPHSAGGHHHHSHSHSNSHSHSQSQSSNHHHSESRSGSGAATTKDADGDESMADPADEDDDEVSAAGSGASDNDEEEDEEGKKYCLCQHVSYGDMVACDNPACPYEWFHWNCVGLKSEPEGRWFCPSCSENMRKKNK